MRTTGFWPDAAAHGAVLTDGEVPTVVGCPTMGQEVGFLIWLLIVSCPAWVGVISFLLCSRRSESNLIITVLAQIVSPDLRIAVSSSSLLHLLPESLQGLFFCACEEPRNSELVIRHLFPLEG